MIDLGAANTDRPGLDVFADAKRTRDMIAGGAEADWRVAWYDGILALASGDLRRAEAQFDGVYSALPGELAPKLALALDTGDWRASGPRLRLLRRGEPHRSGVHDGGGRAGPVPARRG